MKALTTLLCSLVTLSALADSPDAILKDYKARATPALAKVNDTLEKATVPIIADLVKAGDTTGADELKTQLKAKQDGEPVMKPHAKAANLFTLYDAARFKALDPAQRAAVGRIDAMIGSSDGKKLEIVEALGKARADIEAGKVSTPPPAMPVEWTYHGSPTSTSNIAEVHFLPGGHWEMIEAGGKTSGKWKPNQKGDKITIQLADAVWKMEIDGTLATLERPDVGKRYLRVKGAPVGK